MYDKFFEYVNFYHKFAMHWWGTLGPKGYIVILTMVGLLGYFLMLKGPKRLT